MKKLHRQLACALTCFLMLSFITPIIATTDVKTTDWFYDSVTQLSADKRGIIVGYPDGTFRPQNKLTRDQFITMIVRVVGKDPGNAKGYWGQNYIDTAIELELINASDFADYTRPITREEMSMIIVRALENLEGKQNVKNLEQVSQVIKDSNKFTSKYEESVLKTYKLGIITGYPDHTFKPQGVLTRAEASVVVVRLINPDERKEFDFDALYDSMYAGYKSQLLGGANWVNPIIASDAENATEDWSLITGNMGYSPTKYQVETDSVSQQSIDYAKGAFEYDENGPLEGHIESFERLLQRRMPQDQVDIVMEYVEKKTDKYKYLEHDEAFFYLDNNKYLVRIHEVVTFEGTQYEQAIAVNFNIWYRDANFIDEYEEDITQIMPYTDVIIYR